jgi:hypothetical protein
VEIITQTVPVEKLLQILRATGRPASLQGLGGGALLPSSLLLSIYTIIIIIMNNNE